jgi:hypothetical protein
LTLQDYTEITQESINSFFSNLGPNVSNILAAVVILAVGVVVGYILKRILEEILKAIKLEDVLSGWSAYRKVTKSHEDLNITSFFGELLRWITIIIFLVPAIEVLEIFGAQLVVDSVVEYIPDVILASVYLFLGFVIGWFIHRIIQTVGIVVGNNPAHLIANIAYVAIVIFTGIRALLILGATPEILRWILISLLVAAALAVGLGGRDQAMDWVKKLTDKAKE